MITGFDQSPFLDIKKNYLNFMVHSLPWFDSSIIRVLFTLLMEKEPLNQEELIILTDLNRTTISETLSKLMETTSKFIVFQTRKKGERKKYYHCPLNLSFYFQNLLLEGLEFTKTSIKHVSEYLLRLNSIKNQDLEVESFKRFLNDYQKVTSYFHFVVTFFQKNIGKYVSNPESISELIQNVNLERILNTSETTVTSSIRPNDSLETIKRDFLNDQASVQYATIGKKKELVIIGILFFIEGKPITQSYICKITGYSSSTVSTILSDLTKLNIIQIIKKPKDRKKYYESKYTLVQNMLSTIQIMNQIFIKSKNIIEKQFLPNIKNLIGIDKEKDRLINFMTENIRFFELFIDYTRTCDDFVKRLLSRYNL